MHYDFGAVALDVPQVLRDETTYVFENREIGQTLSITLEPPEPRLTPGQVIDELVRPLKSAMAPVFVASSVDLVVLGHPARWCEFQVGPAGRLRMFILVAIGPHATHVVRWTFGIVRDDAPASFARLVDSLRAADEPWTRDAGAGQTRHQAGAITLEVPAALAAPTSFTFATEKGEVRLALEYREEGAAPGAPDFSEVVPLEEDETLTIQSDEERRVVRPALEGWSGRYQLSLASRTGLREPLVRQLKARVSDDTSFVVVGVGVGSGTRQLDAVWKQLEATIVRGK